MKLLVVFIVASAFFNLYVSPLSSCKYNTYEVRIALYDSISPSVTLLEHLANYSWKNGSVRYELYVNRVGFADVMAGTLDSYDVLIIGASGRQYFHGLIPLWRQRVLEFIENGGGYIGICGGANTASLGYKQPRYLMDFIITLSSLGFVDAHVNDDQYGEWQYLWKEEGNANIPIQQHLINHPIFAGHNYRYITYGGGPGFYDMERATPLAWFSQEPMEVAPIHYWRWQHGFVPYEVIPTDILGCAAASEVTVGEGKCIIFSAHPEIPPRLNGTVGEFPGITIYGIPRYVYTWTGGEQQNMSYNWWMVRRSIAYICSLPLPPAEELCLYLRNETDAEIKAYTENAELVEFYVDGELMLVDKEPPFTLPLAGDGQFMVRAVAHSKNNAEAWDERIIEKH